MTSPYLPDWASDSDPNAPWNDRLGDGLDDDWDDDDEECGYCGAVPCRCDQIYEYHRDEKLGA